MNTHTQARMHAHTHTEKKEKKKLTWIILVVTGQEAAMMTHDPLSPSVIGHHSVLHWTEKYKGMQSPTLHPFLFLVFASRLLSSLII